MTGAYVRVKRKGKWENIEFELLTDKEMAEFADKDPEVGWKWAIFFAKYLRDEIKPFLDGMVKNLENVNLKKEEEK
jgi:hypothetical protein